jgi:itaconate CoA-transferase
VLPDAGIANARVNDLAGVWEHPQLQARQRWRELTTPAGPLPALVPPFVPSRVPAHDPAADARMDAVPALGQHTDAILRSLGLDDAGIEALRAAGAV